MKDFDYYRVPNDEYWGYKAKEALRKELEATINLTPLTADERTEKLKEVPSVLREVEKEKNAAPRARQAALDEEFWVDARAECGNDGYTEGAWQVVKNEAYERGHAYGYAEIYSKLVDIGEFVDRLLPHLIEKD